jgi:5-enolpyruvylshikimate-3-phosphate synthase
VDVLQAGKSCEKLCGDLLAVHLRNCMMSKMETLSHRPVGKVVQPLQSVNCHDSRAHGHERHGPFTRLAGTLVGMV